MTEPGPEGTDGELRRLSPLTPIARSGIFLVVAAYAGGREVLQEGRLVGLAIGIVGVVVVGAVFGFASWYRTFFRITPDELRIDTGVLSRRSRRVRLDRVLEVGVNQPLIARLLGLAELRIETGTTESEVTLAYLSLAEAQEVRRILLDSGAAARVREGETPTGAPPPEPQLLLEVPVRWQLLGLAFSAEALGLLVMVVVVVALVLAGVPFGAFGVGFATFVGAAVSLFRKVIGWWDWKVSAVPNGLQVRHGMFGVSQRTFDVRRLQGVRITEPVLQRPFGLARLDLSIAGGGIKDGGENDSNGVAVPVAPRALVWRLAADLLSAELPGADPATVSLVPPPRRAHWLSPFGATWLGFGLDDRLVVARTGWFGRRTDVVPLARVQSFRLHQGPLERAVGVATLHADSPVGLVDVRAHYRDPTDARDLVVTGVERARVARLQPGPAFRGVTQPTDRPVPGPLPPA